MRLSVIICTRNRGTWLPWSLGAVAVQTMTPAEVLVVDSSDPEQARENGEVCERMDSPTLRVRHMVCAPGLTHQRNVGVACSSGEALLFLDDDLVIHPRFVERVAEAMDRDPNVVGVGGVILNEQHRTWLASSYRRLFTMADNISPQITSSGDAGHLFHVSGTQEVSVLSGSNMVFRRELFGSRGLRFDEYLPGYGLMEDVLFCLEAGLHGKLVQTDQAWAFHGFRREDRWSPAFARAHIVNAAYVFARIGKRRGGRSLALWWRLFGRGAYSVAYSLVRGDLESAGAAASGLARVVARWRRAGRASEALLKG